MYKCLLLEQEASFSPLTERVFQLGGAVRYECRRLVQKLGSIQSESSLVETTTVGLWVTALLAQVLQELVQHKPGVPFAVGGGLSPYLCIQKEVAKVKALGGGQPLIDVLKAHEADVLMLFRRDMKQVWETLGILRVTMIVLSSLAFSIVLASKVPNLTFTPLLLVLKTTLEKLTNFKLQELQAIVSKHVKAEHHRFLEELSGQRGVSPTLLIPTILKKVAGYVSSFVTTYVKSPFLANRVKSKCGQQPTRPCTLEALFRATKEVFEEMGTLFYRTLYISGPLMIAKLYAFLDPSLRSTIVSVFRSC